MRVYQVLAILLTSTITLTNTQQTYVRTLTLDEIMLTAKVLPDLGEM